MTWNLSSHLGNTPLPSQPTKLTSLPDYHSAPYGGNNPRIRHHPMDPSRCWFSVCQGQRTNPILMGTSQDLLYPVSVSASVGGRCVPDLQSKVETLPWVTVLWSLAWFAVSCSAVHPTWWNSLWTQFASSQVLFASFLVSGRVRVHPQPRCQHVRIRWRSNIRLKQLFSCTTGLTQSWGTSTINWECGIGRIQSWSCLPSSRAWEQVQINCCVSCMVSVMKIQATTHTIHKTSPYGVSYWVSQTPRQSSKSHVEGRRKEGTGPLDPWVGAAHTSMGCLAPSLRDPYPHINDNKNTSVFELRSYYQSNILTRVAQLMWAYVKLSLK